MYWCHFKVCPFEEGAMDGLGGPDPAGNGLFRYRIPNKY